MPRSKRSDNARGTRDTTGIMSGGTIALTPSGLTMALSGFEYSSGNFMTGTSISDLADAAGSAIGGATAAIAMRHGVTDNGKQPGSLPGHINVSTQLTTIYTAFASLYVADPTITAPDDVSAISCYWSGGNVTVGLHGHSGMIGATPENGVSIAWTAFGV